MQQAVSERLSLSENKSFFWNFDDSCNRICRSLVAEVDANLLCNSVFLQSGILCRYLIGLFLPRNMTYGTFFLLSPGAFLPAQALLEEIISVECKRNPSLSPYISNINNNNRLKIFMLRYGTTFVLFRCDNGLHRLAWIPCEFQCAQQNLL